MATNWLCHPLHGWEHVVHYGHMNVGNFHRLTKATNSPLAHPQRQANVCRFGLRKESVQMSRWSGCQRGCRNVNHVMYSISHRICTWVSIIIAFISYICHIHQGCFTGAGKSQATCRISPLPNHNKTQQRSQSIGFTLPEIWTASNEIRGIGSFSFIRIQQKYFCPVSFTDVGIPVMSENVPWYHCS